MKIEVVKTFGALLLSVFGLVPHVYGITLEEVQVRPAEVKFVCQPIEGSHPVSIQAAVQFKIAGDDPSSSIIYGEPTSKSYQSYKCGTIKSTIYYYQYSDSEEIKNHLMGIKASLWGGDGPTKMHPELMLTIDNVLVVVSSVQPWFFYQLLSHRIAFPSLDDEIINHRLKILQCVKDKEVASLACTALEKFKNGTPLEGLSEEESILFGRSWDISDQGIVGNKKFEVLYFAKLASKINVAAFGLIEPENEDEYNELIQQIESQSNNVSSSSATGLMSYVRQAYGSEYSISKITNNGSLAFIGAGTRVYVRQNGSDVIMLTKLMHDSSPQPYVLSIFPVSPR